MSEHCGKGIHTRCSMQGKVKRTDVITLRHQSKLVLTLHNAKYDFAMVSQHNWACINNCVGRCGILAAFQHVAADADVTKQSMRPVWSDRQLQV